MCGIVGISAQRPIVHHLLAGLQALEYRGYDSAGIAMLTANGIERLRAKGIKGIRSSYPGDLYAHIAVETPVRLTDKQQEAVRSRDRCAACGDASQKSSIFVASPSTQTLPVQMYHHIANTIDPLLASISTLLILLTLVLMMLLDRFYGLDRVLAGKS